MPDDVVLDPGRGADDVTGLHGVHVGPHEHACAPGADEPVLVAIVEMSIEPTARLHPEGAGARHVRPGRARVGADTPHDRVIF